MERVLPAGRLPVGNLEESPPATVASAAEMAGTIPVAAGIVETPAAAAVETVVVGTEAASGTAVETAGVAGHVESTAELLALGLARMLPWPYPGCCLYPSASLT